MQVYSWKDPLVDRAQREREGKSAKVLPKVEKGTWEGSGHDWQLKVEPGLSSFGAHPDDLSDYLKPLFDHATSIIPSDALDDTPVYVLATAGMRLLPDDQRNAVLKNTCSFIEHKTPFKLGMGGCADHVQVITGEEEGLLGWIAINYLMDGFHFKPVGGQEVGTVGHSTFGFLDMGGASTQIAFEPSSSAQEAKPASQELLTPISLRMLDGTDVTHDVFVTTFLGYGTNKARERYLEALAKITGNPDPTSDAPLPDPCLPKGLQKTSQIGKQAVIGTGQFDQCLKDLAPLLDKEAACSQPPCLFHGVHVPPIDFSVNHFIGVSEYWFSSNDVFQLGGAYDFVSFQKAAQAFCGTTWDRLSSQMKEGTVFGKQVNLDRLEMQCFKSAWMATVLHDGIGLPRITDPGGKGDGRVHADDAQDKAGAKNLFQSVNDVNGLAVSWTLGKAVMEASKNIPPLPAANGPHSAPVHGISTPAPTPMSPDLSSSWQDKFAPVWQRPSKILSQGKPSVLSAAAVIVAAVIILIMCLTCLCTHGKGVRGTKRRAQLKSLLTMPWGRRKVPQGDYTLANMEEGANDGEAAVWTDSSGEEDNSHPRATKHQKRRRSSGNSLVKSLLIPIQRIGLALGFRSAVERTPATLSLGTRRKAPPRYPMRHQAVVLPASVSQPASPKSYSAHIANGVNTKPTSYSRPASRASSSPWKALEGQVDGNSYFATGNARPPLASAHTTSALNSNAATATASARSSRAASPAFNHPGHCSIQAHGSRLNLSRASSVGFSRKAWEDD
jgi:Golgi nucleoside diphosphatase